MKWLGVGHEVVPADLMLLEGIGKQYLLQACLNAHPEENLNDAHMNINRMDFGVMKELVNQLGEMELQPLVNVDFRPVQFICPWTIFV